jgi:large subunit ribosomal protein L15
VMIHEITERAGGRRRRKRVGRGESSGLGRTCGRGNKGAQSRSGWGGRILSEGGQMPIFRRLPKRGFSNFNFRTEYEVVNVGALGERFQDGQTVDPQALRQARLVRSSDAKIKILGEGELKCRLAVSAHAFSAAARAAIEKAGGTVQVIESVDPAAAARARRRSARGRKRAAGPSRLEKKKARASAREGAARLS